MKLNILTISSILFLFLCFSCGETLKVTDQSLPKVSIRYIENIRWNNSDSLNKDTTWFYYDKEGYLLKEKWKQQQQWYIHDYIYNSNEVNILKTYPKISSYNKNAVEDSNSLFMLICNVNPKIENLNCDTVPKRRKIIDKYGSDDVKSYDSWGRLKKETKGDVVYQYSYHYDNSGSLKKVVMYKFVKPIKEFKILQTNNEGDWELVNIHNVPNDSNYQVIKRNILYQ